MREKSGVNGFYTAFIFNNLQLDNEANIYLDESDFHLISLALK